MQITKAEIAELERFHSDGVVIEDGQRLYAAGSYCGDCRAYRPCPTATLLAERREREGKLAEAEKVIAWANNSLFGSHGFFLSLDGGPANEHHLDRAIEELKQISNVQYRCAEAAEATLARVRELQREQLARCDQQNADDSESDYERGYIAGKRLVLASIARVLTTPVVSSDRLAPSVETT